MQKGLTSRDIAAAAAVAAADRHGERVIIIVVLAVLPCWRRRRQRRALLVTLNGRRSEHLLTFLAHATLTTVPRGISSWLGINSCPLAPSFVS